ncbi:MAG: N-acyl homoserine lactonase family protein [Gemmatimonadaceae bacterium]
MKRLLIDKVAVCIWTVSFLIGGQGHAQNAKAASPTYEVYAIQYGTLSAFKMSGLIAGADTSRRIDVALMVWLLKGSNGRTVLVDAGFQRSDLIERWKPANYELPSVAVARAGIKAEDVTDIIVSHIHWDHFDGVELFPNAKVWLQREEFTYHIDSTGKVLNRAIDAPDAAMLARLNKAGRVTLVDGDAKEIIPGITVYTGGKHTFQSQYAGVRIANGMVVIASDNAYLYENLEQQRPIAQTLDSLSNLRAQKRMFEIASARKLVVPGHDPAVMSRFERIAPGVVRVR